MILDEEYCVRVEEEKRIYIQKRQIALVKCDFWNKLFFDVLKKHSYQEEFYLVGENPTKAFVADYLQNCLGGLKSKYKISFHRRVEKGRISFSLSFVSPACCSKEIRQYLFDEIWIVIKRGLINLHLLPYSGFENSFPLLDYKIVQSVLEDYCKQFFENPDERYLEFIDFCKRMQNSEEKLTYKTSEIARSSIESIYNASAEKDKKIELGYVGSTLKINGEEILILYQDFLDDPQVLIKKLQKK